MFKGSVCFVTLALLAAPALCFAFKLPMSLNLDEMAALVSLPTKPGNAADFYLKAENIVREKGVSDAVENEKYLKEDSEIYKLMMEGITYKWCVFPYSNEMTLPPYKHPITALNIHRFFTNNAIKKGDEAIEKKDLDKAYEMYSLAFTDGYHLWQDTGLTGIQKLLAAKLMKEAAEALLRMYIDKGDVKNAEICARFAASCQNFSGQITQFFNDIGSNRELKVTDGFKEFIEIFPSITDPVIQYELLVHAGILKSFSNDETAKTVCEKAISMGKKLSDKRLVKVAEWAEKVNKKDFDPDFLEKFF